MDNELDHSIDRAMTRICCYIGAFILAVVTGLSLALWVAYQNSKQVIDSL